MEKEVVLKMIPRNPEDRKQILMEIKEVFANQNMSIEIDIGNNPSSDTRVLSNDLTVQLEDDVNRALTESNANPLQKEDSSLNTAEHPLAPLGRLVTKYIREGLRVFVSTLAGEFIKGRFPPS